MSPEPIDTAALRPWEHNLPLLREGDPFGWVDREGRLHVDFIPAGYDNGCGVVLGPDPIEQAARLIRRLCVGAEPVKSPWWKRMWKR